MEKIKTLRGFRDILGEEIDKFRRIEQVSRKYLGLFGFSEIAIPILEKTELFVRSIGDTTDIVEKEMFTFRDMGGDSLTLRPEATAGMVRAYLQAGMYAKERVSKLFTIGPMFRHEKPQKGRFRQFHQVDIEVFGAEGPLLDGELLWMVCLMLEELGVSNHVTEINSVGCPTCRETFRSVLTDYFGTKTGELCEDCLRRLERNPLRIFDCKNQGCIDVSGLSPFLFDYLCEACRVHFDGLLKYLDQFGVNFTVNKRLVRGLDYYTKTVFEVTSGDLGAQKAFLAGGRYDNLVEEMEGPKTPAIGFAAGMERLALLMSPAAATKEPSYFFASMGERARRYLVPMLQASVIGGLRLNFSYEERSLKSQMRYADNLHADYVFILGDDEIDKGIIIVRDMNTKNQYELPLEPSKVFPEMAKLLAK
jgi:histidyl-tRNA synthetase